MEMIDLPGNISTLKNCWPNSTDCDRSTQGGHANTSTEYTTAAPGTPPYGLELTIFLAVLAGLTSLCTVTGNILVLVCFILERGLRQPANYLIASLAVTDVLLGMFSMPFYTLYLLTGYQWPLGQTLCDLWLALDYTVCLVSQYTVFLITLDRFCSVKIPAKYRNWRTERKVKAMIAITWLVPSLIFFTTIIGWRKFLNQQDPANGICEAQFQKDPTFTAVLVISYYWVTLIVMTGLYAGIYKVALMLHMKSSAKRRKVKRMTTAEVNKPESDKQNDNTSRHKLLDSQHNSPVGTPNTESQKDKSQNGNRSVVTRALQNREDSDLSNEHSSDSIPSHEPKVLIGMKVHTLMPNMIGSPVWKPRRSLPDASIHWEAFKDGVSTAPKQRHNDGDLYRTVSTDDKIDGGSQQDIKSFANNTSLGPIRRALSHVTHGKELIIQSMRSSGKEDKHQKSKSENRARKALRTITVILGAFVLCWTPYHIFVLVEAFCPNESKPCVNQKLYDFSYWLCYMNSPINPFCYALANRQFKKAFLKIFRREYTKHLC